MMGDWRGLHSWLHSVQVVTFDLELGQVIESVYPDSLADPLSEQDKTNVCYLAFPDSNSGIMGDIQFHFRIRRSSAPVRESPSVSECHESYNAKCQQPLRIDHNFLFGFAYFRQVKDASIRRGYYQKSVILLTYLPLVTFFTQMAALVARKYFEAGELPVEVACHEVERWPGPQPGHHLTLPLLGALLQLHIPGPADLTAQQETVSLAGSSAAAATCHTELFTVLRPLLDHLHSLWELALTAEPLVVQAPSPAQCSATVQALTTIIHPLSFVADYRPFYTIHDTDFKELTSSNSSALPAIILGVTNPFFNKASQSFKIKKS